MRFIGIVLIIFMTSCQLSENSDDSYGKDKSINQYQEDSNKDLLPDESSVFKTVILGAYPQIYKNKFDTLAENAFVEYSDLKKHRLLSIILAKNEVEESDLKKISSLHQCTCKHFSIKKKDSPDLVIEEYVCENANDASFWFQKIYNCYMTNDNPLGEPLKEPFKIWQSDNRIIHAYTRAEMWRSALDSINKSLMKNFVFDRNRDE